MPATKKAKADYEPMRFDLDWTEPRAFRALIEPSAAGLGRVNWVKVGCGSAVFLGVLLLSIGRSIAVGDFRAETWQFTFFAGGFVLGLVALLVLLAIAKGAYSYEAGIGAKGISLLKSAGGGTAPVLRSRVSFGRDDDLGRTISWDDVRGVEYHERYPLGGKFWRVLVVQTALGTREPIGIPDGMPRERIARTLEAWGKHLDDVVAQR
jgi:hypothetical protein